MAQNSAHLLALVYSIPSTRVAQNRGVNVCVEIKMAIQRWEDEGGRCGSAPILTSSSTVGHREKFSYAWSQERELKSARFWTVAKLLQWGGFGTAGVCLLRVMTGGGFFECAVGVAAAFVGSVASGLVNHLGPHRLLKEIRVKEVLTPTCLTVPHYTRLGNLMTKHSFSAGCCCAATRDGSVLGVLSGADLIAVDLQRHSHEAVELHMRPLSWIEAIDIAEDAVEAMAWMKRYRRSFLPVLDQNRVVGIITKGRIIQEARRRRASL